MIDDRPFFSLTNAHFDYEPYPICCASDVFPPALYEEMLKEWPSKELFHYRTNGAAKYALSQYNHPPQYRAFVQNNGVWREFHHYIKSDEFLISTIEFLKQNNIDFGLGPFKVGSRRNTAFSDRRSSWLCRLTRTPELSARFEFSMMAGNGGNIRPHTDDPLKIITFVMTMVRPEEWNETWGGGTVVSVPRDRRLIFNQTNRYLHFGDMETVRTYEFRPNQCLLFVKTYNSWHHVAPIRAPNPNVLRKTLTINIERFA